MGSNNSRDSSPSELDTLLATLYTSLEAYSDRPDTASDALLSKFPVDNNPRLFREYGDHAQYWIGDKGQVLTLTFPAILNTSRKFVKSSPYFNLNTGKEV
jgi:hypothetical protein